MIIFNDFHYFFAASKNVSDWWLSYWVTHSHTGKNSSMDLHFMSQLPDSNGPVMLNYMR